MKTLNMIESTALFSDDRTYRYMLSRTWDDTLPKAVFIGLNPSTADEKKDDATIRRCISYASQWNMGGIIMLNLFAYRSTDPKALKKVVDPVGPMNDLVLKEFGKSDLVIAAWGNHGSLFGREEEVTQMLPSVFALSLTKSGHPSHPLYLKKNLIPVPWVKG